MGVLELKFEFEPQGKKNRKLLKPISKAIKSTPIPWSIASRLAIPQNVFTFKWMLMIIGSLTVGIIFYTTSCSHYLWSSHKLQPNQWFQTRTNRKRTASIRFIEQTTWGCCQWEENSKIRLFATANAESSKMLSIMVSRRRRRRSNLGLCFLTSIDQSQWFTMVFSWDHSPISP